MRAWQEKLTDLSEALREVDDLVERAGRVEVWSAVDACRIARACEHAATLHSLLGDTVARLGELREVAVGQVVDMID